MVLSNSKSQKNSKIRIRICLKSLYSFPPNSSRKTCWSKDNHSSDSFLNVLQSWFKGKWVFARTSFSATIRCNFPPSRLWVRRADVLFTATLLPQHPNSFLAFKHHNAWKLAVPPMLLVQSQSSVTSPHGQPPPVLQHLRVSSSPRPSKLLMDNLDRLICLDLAK